MVPPPFRLPVLYFPNPATAPPQSSIVMQSKKASRQKFSPEEDQKLKELVLELGESNWNEVSNRLGTRSARQCRERFKNYLSPSIKNDPWSEEDDLKLRSKFLEFGPKWSQIARFFPSRSEVNIKNHWARLVNKNSREHDLEAEKRQLIQQIDMVIENTKRMNLGNQYPQAPNSGGSHLPLLPSPSIIMGTAAKSEPKPGTDILGQFNTLSDSLPIAPFDNELGSLEWENSDDQNSFISFFEFTPFSL
ncbi:hypothetical protein M9Y10_044563 [Tritrichomonas musculus]|uniref:Myb-like DNA-binding domain containing protein n=1 Tax=Tritrichomonas musculus TaxID=1915356 RepID=A0ABR2JSP6_9EUKA